MTTRWRPVRDERGQGVVTLVIVAVVLVVAVGLLIRTATLAGNVRAKTQRIAETGRGIGQATDAIIQLDQTNQLGKSILETSKPLVPSLNETVNIAKSIDGLATSINATALDIGSTIGGINTTASSILTVAQSINRGVEQINRNVDVTIDLARRVKGDTGNILGQAQITHEQGACIDQALTKAADGHCR